jgi:hypothetical protein
MKVNDALLHYATYIFFYFIVALKELVLLS